MDQAPTSIVMATWNLWWRFGGWADRLEPIFATMAGVDADIWTLQEVWDDGDQNQAARLAERLGLFHVWAPYPDHGHWRRRADPDSTDVAIGTAILSRWPIADVVHVALPTDGHIIGRGTIHRACVDSPAGPIDVVTTHLSSTWGRSDLRQMQLTEVVRFIADVRTDRPLVLTGDMNAVPESDEIRRLVGLAPAYVPGVALIDVWADVRSQDAGWTWSRANPHAAQHGEPNGRIDFIFVDPTRPSMLVQPVGCELFGADRVAGVWPSDHFGVRCELTIRPRRG